jgi:hypothetical protein
MLCHRGVDCIFKGDNGVCDVVVATLGNIDEPEVFFHVTGDALGKDM